MFHVGSQFGSSAFDSIIEHWEHALASRDTRWLHWEHALASRDTRSSPSRQQRGRKSLDAAPALLESQSASAHHAVQLLHLPRDVLHVVAQHVVSGPCEPFPLPPSDSFASGNSAPVVRRLSTWDTQGLKDGVYMSLACRELRAVHLRLLQERRDLMQQAEENTRVLEEKHRLVRRLTIDHYTPLVHREVAVEVAGGTLLVTGLLAACSMHGLCGTEVEVLHAVVVAMVHMLMHTLVLGSAYRCCARLGVMRTLGLGLAVVLASSQLLWVLRDQAGVQWGVIHLVSFALAWAYGTYEFKAAHSYLKLCNGLN